MIEIKEIKKPIKNEIVIEKSKFITYSATIHSVMEAENFLTKLKNEHSNATHICYAFCIFGGNEKAFDDGEPQGTAGKPILDCIKKQGYTNVLIAVVRYFGGIKLGAGGLLRAYSNSASNALKLSGEKTSVMCKKMSFFTDLSNVKQLKQLPQISELKCYEIVYGEKIKVDLYHVPEDREILQLSLQNLFLKNIDFIDCDEVFFK